MHALNALNGAPVAELNTEHCEQFEFIIEDWRFLPLTSWNTLDTKCTLVCHCSKYARVTCLCRAALVNVSHSVVVKN